MIQHKSRLVFVLLITSIFSPVLCAQNAAPASTTNQQPSSSVTHVPDFSGVWAVEGGSPSWDPSDPRGAKPDQLPMTPWAVEKFKAARPPFGSHGTFEAVNDPVQKDCDPPGITRLNNYAWQFILVQNPRTVYILYEFPDVWPATALDREHPKSPDSTWIGDSIGKSEGDTF